MTLQNFSEISVYYKSQFILKRINSGLKKGEIVQCKNVSVLVLQWVVNFRFRVLQSRVRVGYGYTLKFETRVPSTLRVIGG